MADLVGKAIGFYFVLAGRRCFGIVLSVVRPRVFSLMVVPRRYLVNNAAPV